MGGEPYADQYHGDLRDICVYGDYVAISLDRWVEHDDDGGGAGGGDATFVLYY